MKNLIQFLVLVMLFSLFLIIIIISVSISATFVSAASKEINAPDYKSFIVNIARPYIAKGGFLFCRENDDYVICPNLTSNTNAYTGDSIINVLVNISSFGGVRDTGNSAKPHNLTIFSNGATVEYSVWYEGSYVNGQVTAGVGNSQEVVIPHYQSFIISIARPASSYMSWLFCRENDNYVTCSVVQGGTFINTLDSTVDYLLNISNFGGVKDTGNSAKFQNITIFSNGETIEYSVWYSDSYSQGEVTAGAGNSKEIVYPHYNSFLLNIARPVSGKSAWLFCRENDKLLGCYILQDGNYAYTRDTVVDNLINISGFGGVRDTGTDKARALEIYTSAADVVEYSLWYNGNINNSEVNPACNCTTGTCCDGCNYRASSYVCNSHYGNYNYNCTSGQCLGDDVKRRDQQQFCSGSSSNCTGTISWNSWEVYDNCTTTEFCNQSKSGTTAFNCTTAQCPSGVCCNTTCGKYSFLPSSTVCSVFNEFACPWGTLLGNDVGNRTNTQRCSGSSSTCNGAITNGTGWSIFDNCNATEFCISGNQVCQIPQCTSGACCNLTTYTYIPNSVVCNNQAAKEYGCLAGQVPGADLSIHYKSQYCSGSSSSCNGALSGWQPWQLQQDCFDNQVCVVNSTNGECANLKIRAVMAPVGWNEKHGFWPFEWTTSSSWGSQNGFNSEVDKQFSHFLNDTGLKDCPYMVEVKKLNVDTQQWKGFFCNDDCDELDGLWDYVDGLAFDLTNYDYVFGFVKSVPDSCDSTRGCSSGTTIWMDIGDSSVTSHETGHLFGLSDEYCSNQAGSSDSRCNDGDSQNDNATTGDKNYISSLYSCNPGDRKGCCGGDNWITTSSFPFVEGPVDPKLKPCKDANYGACCLGNKNSLGGRATMSYYGAPGPRKHDVVSINHLNTKNKLKCPATSYGGGGYVNASAAGAMPIQIMSSKSETKNSGPMNPGPGDNWLLNVRLKIFSDNHVEENKIIWSEQGTPGDYYTNGSYTMKLIDPMAGGIVLWSVSFPLYFDYYGPRLLEDDYSKLIIRSMPLNFKVPYPYSISMKNLLLNIEHNGTIIYSKPIPPFPFCNNNGMCDTLETNLNCPAECPIFMSDMVCSGTADGICDPDCALESDVDCIGNNVPPVLNKISDINAKEGEIILIKAFARDANEDTLTYSIDDQKFKTNFNLFSWETGAGDAGHYNVQVSVMDSFGHTTFQNIGITVIAADADADSIPDALDNCPNAANADQADSDAITNGIVSYWKFNEGPDAAKDYAGDNTGIVSGAEWILNDSVQASSLKFTDDNIKVPANPTLDLSSGISIEAWIKPFSNTNAAIICKGNSTCSYGFSLLSNGKIQAYVSTGETDNFDSTSSIPLGNWTHILVTYDRISKKIYINGKKDREVLGNSLILINNNDFYFGNNFDNTKAFNGLIDEVAMYNRALTDNEINMSYRNTLNRQSYLGDGFGDTCDNCQYIANNQVDSNNDGIGDVCSPMAGIADLSLNSGWNLISLALVPGNNSVENVFSSIMNKVIVINGFESGVGGGAKTYDPLLPEFSDLQNIDSYHGYWVKLSQSANLSENGIPSINKTINLETGWNLISYLGDEPRSTSDVISAITSKVIVVNGFENGALTYDPLLPEFSDLQVMKPNYGYWIKMSAPGVLNYVVSSEKTYTCCLNNFDVTCFQATIADCRAQNGAVMECVPTSVNGSLIFTVVNYTKINTTTQSGWLANLTTVANNTRSKATYNASSYDCDDFADDLEKNLTAAGYNATFTAYWWNNGTGYPGHAVTDVHAPDGSLVFIEPQTGKVVDLDFDGDGKVEAKHNEHTAGFNPTDDGKDIEVYDDAATAAAKGCPMD